MQYTLCMLTALGGLAASASIASRDNHDWPSPVRDYYSTVGRRVAAVKKADNDTPPACNVASATPPVAPTPLPSPSPGLSVYHVAIGRGTQNYTCASNSSADTPVANGALATLFNASCIAALYPDVLATLPAAALAYPVPTSSNPMAPSNLLLSGHHYFSDSTTPTFDLVTSNGDFGVTYSKKKAASVAPAPVGKSNIMGYGNVPWLQLQAVMLSGSEGVVQEVYRLNTAGGTPPPTCAGQQAHFVIQYAAEYWFYA